MLELLLRGQLQLSGPEALGYGFRRIGASALEAFAQFGGLGGSDEEQDGLRHRRAHLARTLYLDLEHHRLAVGEMAVELGAKRSVAVAAIGRVLNELPVVSAPAELIAIQEE